jgi:hypothetical protein
VESLLDLPDAANLVRRNANAPGTAALESPLFLHPP